MKVLNQLMFVLLLAVTFSSTYFAQSESKCFIDENNAAIKGYDVVSYFTEGKAVKGNHDYSSNFDNAVFYFSSEKNKKAFDKSPMKYIPQYGGYCAFAMGKLNKKVPTDPKTFKIVDGKLYLFFNGEMKGKKMNTLIPWNKNEKELKKLADANWEKMQ